MYLNYARVHPSLLVVSFFFFKCSWPPVAPDSNVNNATNQSLRWSRQIKRWAFYFKFYHDRILAVGISHVFHVSVLLFDLVSIAIFAGPARMPYVFLFYSLYMESCRITALALRYDEKLGAPEVYQLTVIYFRQRCIRLILTHLLVQGALSNRQSKKGQKRLLRDLNEVEGDRRRSRSRRHLLLKRRRMTVVTVQMRTRKTFFLLLLIGQRRRRNQ